MTTRPTALGALLHLGPADHVPAAPEGSRLLVLTMNEPEGSRRAEVVLDPETIAWLRSALPSEPGAPTQTAPSQTPSGPECYRRAAGLLDQAFATKIERSGDPWASEPRVVNVLDDAERLVYTTAAQAYAALAQAAATVDHTAARGVGDVGAEWRQLLVDGVPE